MAENSNSGGIGGLYFIVGGLVVVAGIGFFVYNGGHLGGGHGTSTTTEKTSVAAPAPAGSTTTTTTEKTTH